MTRPSAAARNRRHQLLARSALAGLGVAVVMTATPALAQVTGVGTVTGTTSNGGAVGVFSGAGSTDISTGASRSIVDWTSLNVTSTEQLNFFFNNRQDIVLNRVAGSASIDGILRGCVSTCATPGGNVWILSVSGVVIGANAQISTGGFLASVGDVTNADFLDGDMNFAFTGYDEGTVSVAGGATINTSGGSIALIAPRVTTAAGSTVSASGAGNVLYGSATNYNVTFAPTADNDLDLISFEVPSQADGAGGLYGGMMILDGATSGNRVFAAIVSKAGLNSTLLNTGAITATSVATDETGAIVLSNNRSIVGGAVSTPIVAAGTGTVTNHGVLTAPSVTLAAAGALLFSTDINAAGGAVALSSDTGTVHQNSGVITADTLTVSAATDIVLAAGFDGDVNNVAQLAGLTSTTGDISYAGGSFQITGAISTPGLVGLSSTGTISGAGTISAGSISLSGQGAINVLGDANLLYSVSTGNLTIEATGGIAMTDGWDLNGHTLTLTAVSGSILQTGDAIFDGGTLLATATGDIDFSQSNYVTAFAGNSAGGDITFRGNGGFAVGPIVTSGELGLTSDTGSITASAGIITSRLTASAAGSITLDGTIVSLGDVTAGANILLNTYSAAMDLTGDVTGQTVSLYAGGGVTQSGGKIDASRINVITSGAISLTGANEIDVVGRLETDQDLSGTGGNITLRNVGNIVLDYLVNAPGATVTFTSDTGAITQTGFGMITANRLTASAAGNITIYDGGNDVATIGGLASANGDIVYRDINGFDIQGDITANSAITRGVMLVAGGAGAITQTSGVLDVGYFRGVTGGSISLGGANQIRRLISTVIGNGALTLNTTTNLSVDGTVSANTVSLTSTAAITQATNAQIWTNTLNASAVTGVNLTASGFGANNIAALGTVTNTTSGGVTVSNAMNFNLTGAITASGQAVSITNTQGSISQTGGIITADTLSLSATTGITATRNNVVGSLGPVTAGGNFAFTNVGDLYLSGNIDVGANTVSLTSNTGQIEQTVGVITAGSLNLQTGGRIWLNNANAVTSLGTLTAGGHILFRNQGNTVVGGDITATGLDVTLWSNAGSVTQTAGSDITSNSLQVIAQTGATLTNAGNAINQLAWADTAGGGFAFSQTNGFQIVGPVLAGGQTVSLTSLSGAITQTSGSVLQAGLLNASAAGTLALNQGNNVTSLGVISSGGSFLFNDLDGFALTGNITAANQVVMLAQGGSITQTGGIITANAINATATVDLLLGGANQIGAINALSAGNDLLYRQVGDLAVPTISASGTVSLYSTTGDITQTGTITADTLVLGAFDDITLGQNFVAKLGQIDAGGDFDASNAAGLSSGALGLTGNITVGGAMTLVNPGAIFQTSSTGITAGSLFIDTDGALGATGANSISGNTRLSATGAVFNAVGDLTLQVNVTGFATIVSDGAVVFDGVGASTGDTLNVEAVNGISQGAAGLNFTNFGNLTNTTSGGIDLTNSSWLTLNGAISAVGQYVALNVVSGGIIQSSGSTITANRLGVTSTQGALMGEMNQVDELGVINVGAHNFLFRTLGDLLIDGDITSTLNVNLTSATGSVSQTAGSDITAGTLNVTAETGISLTNAGNDVGMLRTMINLGSSGGIAYAQTDGFQIDSVIRALNQTVSLTSLAGGISETGTTFAQIEARTLNVSAGGAVSLHRDNDIDNLGVISAVGGFTFNDVDGFNLTGNLTGGGAAVLDAQAGSIVQLAGVINATSIDAAASGNLDLGSANVVGAVTALSAGGDMLYRQVGDLSVPAITVTGSLSLYSTTGSISQTGALSAATLNLGAANSIMLTNLANTFGALANLSSGSENIYVSEADGFDLTGAITTSPAGLVTLAVVSGAITQQAGATIEAGGLELFAAGGATLDGDNDIDVLTGAITTGAAFTFNDVDGFDLLGNIDAQTATLTSGGAITQGAGGIHVGTLSLTAASATLNGANEVDALADIDVTGDMSFHDIGDINLNGNQTVGGTLALTSGAIIRQLGSGVLDVGRFEANAVGGVLLGNSGNAVASLGDISTTSGIISIVNTSHLTIDGDLSATGAGGAVSVRFGSGGVAMTNTASIITGGNVEIIGAGDIVLGAITANWLWTISHSGTISSTAAPTIVVNRLTGSAADSFVLTGSNIDINEFAFNAADEISVTGNNGPLDLSGQVTAQTVTLGSTGAITQSGGLVRATVATLSGDSIVANRANEVQTVNLNGSSISFTNAGSFAANVVTSTGAVSLTSTTGAITQTALTGRIVADSLTASAATGLEFFGGQNDIRVLAGLSSTGGGVTWRDMGGFQITGNIDAAGQTVELVSDGTGADGTDVTQSGGVITANRLQGTSAGDLLFTSANVVGQLGYLNAGGNIRFRGAASYTLQDNVNAGGGLILNADTGSIQQFGGAIVADAFAGNAAQGISLTRVNDVDFLGAIDSGAGDFNFRDLDSFDIAGLITSDNGILLQAGGNISQSSGSIVTGTLSLFASIAVLNGSGNDIDFLGESTGMAALAFTDVDGFDISDRVFSSGAISLTATTGDIAEVAGGYLSANGLNVYASNGEIDLAGDNTIENVGDLMAGGDVTFHETDGFLTFGNIAGDAVRLTTADGAISQINGAIGANSLYASALTGLNLSAIGNDVDVITGLVNLTSGGISYHNADSVSITGAVTAIGQTVNFDVNGNLSQTVTGVISAGRVQGAAMGVFALADAANVVAELGPVSATSIDLVTVDTGLTIVGALYATNGVALKADDFITQTASGTITATTLRAQADGDIILDQGNDVGSIYLLYSDLGDITYTDIGSFSLDASSYGDIWTGGTLTLTAGGLGDIDQFGAGLHAGTLIVSAGGYINLDEDNGVTSLGAITAGSYIYYYDRDDIAVNGDVNAGGSFNIVSINGDVTQTGGLITATTISGQSDGDFTLNNFDAHLNSAVTTVGDIDISTSGDLIIDNLVRAGGGASVTLTSGGFISTTAAGRIEAGALTLSAGTSINLNSASQNDVDTLAGVIAGTSFNFIDDDGFNLSGDIDIDGGAFGTTAILRSVGGAIAQTGGAIVADGLVVEADAGVNLSGQNLVGALQITNGSGDVYFTNAQDLGVVSATSDGLVDIGTTTGRLDVIGQIFGGSIVLTGANGAYASALLQATGDVTVTAVTGNAMAASITAGDDVLVEATVGSAQLQSVSLYADVDPEADGQTVRVIAAGNAFLGATSEAGILSQTLSRVSGGGTVSVTSTGGDANVFLSSMDTAVTTLSAGGDGATARAVLQNGDLSLGSVTGDNVSLTAHGGMVSATQVTVGGGDYDLTGADFSSGAITVSGTARDRTITDTAGDLELVTNVFAQRALTIIAQGSVLNGTGSVNIAAGLGGQGGDLNITAASIAAYFVRGDGNVILTALSGGIDIGTVLVAGDYSLTGDGFSGGTLSPLGGKAGTWSLTALGALDFTGRTLSYRGDIDIQANDDITGGNVRSINGSVSIDGPSAIDVESLYAATDIIVTTTGDLTLDSATAHGGDISVTGRDSLTVEGFLDAAGDVTATSNNGTADVAAATAGGNITVQTTSGDAILGAAALTGATGDLTVLATGGGDVIFGVLDYTTVSTDNVFSRAAGSTGTVTLMSVTGDVTANLWSSARLDLVRAFVDAEVSTETGDLSIGQIETMGGDIYAEAVDGDLTIGEASAPNGFLSLYAGGNLTILDSAYGNAGVAIEVGGLLDGSLASQIVSRGDMRLAGGSVDVGRIAADGDILVEALDDAYVEFAEADGLITVGSFAGNATLRGGLAGDGIGVFADLDATFGADTRALTTSDNRASVTGGCGCGAFGIAVIATSGNAVVNLDTVSGEFAGISALLGDVNVNLLNGNLTIGELSGRNITVEVAGSIRTGAGGSPIGANVTGGSYSITAAGFLGDVLNPLLVDEFGDPSTLQNYTIVQRGGVLDMTGVQVTAQGDIVVTNTAGNLVGDVQLTAAGDVTVTANGVAVDTIDAGGDVALNAGAANVNVATSVTVGGDYSLAGADFSLAALSPLGAKAGDLRITDNDGDFDYSSATLTWGGDITISAMGGTVLGGDITSASGNIEIQGNGIDVGVLSAANGQIDAYAYGGPGANVASATALDDIYIYTSSGNAILGAATLLGTGTNTLLVNADGVGSAILGSTTAGGITGANSFTSNGSTTTANVQAAGGNAYVRLDTSDAITGVTAFGGNIGISVRSGDFDLGSAYTNGEIDIDGPDGQLTVGSLTADGNIDIHGADITLTDVGTTWNLFVTASGDLAFAGPDGVRSGRIAVDSWIVLEAGGDVTQDADAGFRAVRLTVDANAISLLGLNQVETIGNVSGDSFAYRSIRAGGFDIGGGIDVGGGTVELIAENGGITQGSGYSIFAGSLTGSSQGGADFAGHNYVDALGDFDNTGGAFVLNVPQALNIVGTVQSDSAVLIQSVGGGMTIASTGTVSSTGSGDAIVLASDGVFTNNSGADAVQAANGRWLIYTQAQGNPNGSTAGDSYGGLVGKNYYGTAYDFATGDFSGPINAGNRIVHAYQPILTVTPVSQTVTYNGQIPTLTATILGLINGDLAADAWSGQAAISGATSKNVGTYGLLASLGSLLSDMNYAFDFGTGVLNIDPKTLTGTVNADDKTYDGSAGATGTISLTGVISGDDVSANAGSYAFDDKNAGINKTVTAYGATLGGADAGNYTLDPLATAIADILRKALTGTLTANGKTYDGATTTTGTVSLTGVVLGDDVSANGGTFAFADKNAGLGKTVTATGVGLAGGDAANYDLTAVSTALADILRKAVTGTLTADNKTYDGTAAASGSISLTGVVAGDTVSADGTYSFADKSAAAGKTVTATGVTLSGIDGDNYDLTAVSTAIADILRKSLTGTLTASNKTYDGTATASGSVSLTGVIAGDDVAAGGTYAFADKNAGVGRTVTASGAALSGADAANYDLAAVSTAIADVLRKSLTGTLTASNKTYDGTTAASGSVALTGVVAGDTVTAAGTYAFADKNAAAGKTVTASGVALAGADSANYQLDPLAAAVADILRKTITATVAVNNKTYDGTAAATGTVSLTGVVAGDTVTGGGTYSFADANAGVGKTVAVAGVALSGADAANYNLTAPASTAIADILRRQIAVRADDKTKLFGQLDPAFTFSITSGSLVGGDDFTGSLAREIGDAFGDYQITQGTVALSLNYEILFTPGLLTIRPVPGGGQDGGDAFKYLRSPGSVGLDWDPTENLTYDHAPMCLSVSGCGPAGPAGAADTLASDAPGPARTVAMLGWRRFLPGAIGGKVSVD